MGVIEDVRKVLQDVIAPDLKAIDARLNALDKKLDLTREVLTAQMNTMQATLVAEIARLDRSADLERRIEKLETERTSTPARGFAPRRLGVHRP